MRLVLDTNVLVSAVFFGGVPGRVHAKTQEGGGVVTLEDRTLPARTVGGRVAVQSP